ncbi:MAG: hypothetical protein ACXVJD_00245 [Mucilaginibacter sp.]
MNTQDLPIIDIGQKAGAANAYLNVPVAAVNDHVVRMSVMTEPYFWHCTRIRMRVFW